MLAVAKAAAIVGSLGAALGCALWWCGGTDLSAGGASVASGTSASSSAGSGQGGGGDGGSSGMGCSEQVPKGFAYQPGCCKYLVDVPQVSESGFDDGKVVGSAKPDHIHASFAGPSATSFAVNWRSDAATTASALLYGTDRGAVTSAAGPNAQVKLVRGHHFRYGSAAKRWHEAHACGLSPSTKYSYSRRSATAATIRRRSRRSPRRSRRTRPM